MATVVAPTHRHQAIWLRILEDVAIVTGIALVGWLLVARAVPLDGPSVSRFLPTLLGPSSPAEGESLSIVAASRPMFRAVKVASALEEQGVFGAEAGAAWQNAARECRRLAVQPITTARGSSIRLWLLEAEEERAEELAALVAMPGKAPEEVEALAALRAEAIDNAAVIRRYRELVNFDHWKAVCEIESSAPVLEARESAWLAARAADAGRPDEARDALEASFRSWRTVLDARPEMLHDPLVVEELAAQVGSYRGVLATLGGQFPRSFILQDVLDEAGRIEHR